MKVNIYCLTCDKETNCYERRLEGLTEWVCAECSCVAGESYDDEISFTADTEVDPADTAANQGAQS